MLETEFAGKRPFGSTLQSVRNTTYIAVRAAWPRDQASTSRTEEISYERALLELLPGGSGPRWINWMACDRWKRDRIGGQQEQGHRRRRYFPGDGRQADR